METRNNFVFFLFIVATTARATNTVIDKTIQSIHTTNSQNENRAGNHYNDTEIDFSEKLDNGTDYIYNADVDQNKSKEINQNTTMVQNIILFDQFLFNVSGFPEKNDNTIRPIGIVPGKLAAILAGVFLLIAFIGYVLMLSRRRYLENRYGNREMLVEDDKINFDHVSVSAPYTESNATELQYMSIFKSKKGFEVF